MKIKIALMAIVFLICTVNIALAQEQLAVESELAQVSPGGPIEKCQSNLGEACNINNDCQGCFGLQAFCLLCPEGTIMQIQVDADPYYAKLANKTTLITKEGGSSYCGYYTNTKCVGKWNEDEYYIDSSFFIDTECAGEHCISSEEKLPLVGLLGKDVLEAWKSEVLKTVSEGYFSQHFDVDRMYGYVRIDNEGNHKLEARIYYKFKYDWAATLEAGEGESFDILTAAEKKGGSWQKLTKEEISSYYQKELERVHGLGKIKFTEQEINSIISKEEALAKLKNCHEDMEIGQIFISSENNKLYFNVLGQVDTNRGNCVISSNNKYTVVFSSINLITGESNCEAREAPCVVYESKTNVLKTLLKKDWRMYGIIIIIILIILLIIAAVINRNIRVKKRMGPTGFEPATL